MKKQQNFLPEDISGAWDLIEKAKTITLLTHRKPDGDGIGACGALEIVLERLGKMVVTKAVETKAVETVYPDAPEFEYKRQPCSVSIGKHTQVPDLLIACDTASYQQLYYPDEFKGIDLINIDHHVSNSLKGTFNFVDAQSSSACEVVFLLLSVWGEAFGKTLIDKAVAEFLLSGILYDSQVFHTQSTTTRTLRVAADLVDYGVDLFQLKVELFSNKDPKVVQLWSKLLDRIEISKNGKACWTFIMQHDLKAEGLQVASLVGFNNFLASIAGIDVTLLFYETDDGKTKVSLRSKEYDVNKLAGKFGGGGHKHAAGILSDRLLGELMGEVVKSL
ncbi:DHH family phosphoesterase [Candidatus Babeliales bacterium]|nr:DHH family phosphoesterase [Candidatus Babeliales bacterium]